ncbi:hypothetical protein BG006_000607 [Podila minutissima]|uniref:Adhesin domain-containing protein n=1 Tax=Podila minutissima TaxID=64525 RepID=A0A9P5VRL3_9FUNG|nr:hypothetical protein BG006_000607 [Podila minutissima]
MNSSPNDGNESAPLLNPRFRDLRKEREQDRKIRNLTIIASVLGLLVLFEFITGLYLDNEGYSLAKGLPYPVPARVAPVCNLEQVEVEHSISILPGEGNFQVIQVLLDEGVAGDINISINDDEDATDIYIVHSRRFSHKSIQPHLDAVNLVNFGAPNPVYSLSYMLNYTQDERRDFLYDRHRCASVDIRIVFPQFYPFDRLELQTLYRGDININMENREVNLIKAKTVRGNINIKHTGAADMVLEAPGGAIDASISTFNKLETYSAENTVIDMIDWPFLLDMRSVSEKSIIVKYPYKGHFTLSSTTRPVLTGNLDVPLTFTKKNKNMLEGFIGVDWMNQDVMPRMFLTAHDTKLVLKDPLLDDELVLQQKRLEQRGIAYTHARGVFNNKLPVVLRPKKVEK